MSAPQNRDRSGRFPKGISGNPGGRPQGLAKATREIVGEEGKKIAEFWWSIVQDETRRDSDRLEASRLLADRGWGKAAVYQPQEGDPLDLASMEHGSGLGRARWVVERTFAWLHHFKRLLVRYDRRAEIHEAFLALGCCRVCFRRLRCSF